MVEEGSKLVFLKSFWKIEFIVTRMYEAAKGMGFQGWAKWNYYDFHVHSGFVFPG